MDADRFDTLTRSLSAAGLRHRGLDLDFSGAVGLLSLAQAYLLTGWGSAPGGGE